MRARKSLAAALIGRRWNAATVGEVSTAWRGSDTSPAAFARAHGIGVWRLGWWRKRLDAGAGGRNGRTTQLAPLTFLPATVAGGTGVGIAIRLPGGVEVEATDVSALPVRWVAALARELRTP